MLSRRRFIEILSLGIITPSKAIPQDAKNSTKRFFSFLQPVEAGKPEHKPEPTKWNPSTITASLIGHSTVLINFFGTTIITDPVFSQRAGINILGLATIGPKRITEPALLFSELPPIDIILISHSHMAHLDLRTLRRFNGDIPVVMAKNTSDIVDVLGLKRVSEMDWGEKSKVSDVEIEAIQVKHFGWRYPWEVDRSMGVWEGRSFNAYLLTKKGHSVLFGGDMGYHEFFKTIGQRNLSIELAILPIGTYKPWIQNHCNPEQALVMTEHLRAKRILPIHFKSFIMSDEPVEEPIQRLKEASKSNPNCVALDRIGQTWTMTESVEKS